MVQGVDLLKELLFESEAKKLAELTRRLELLAKSEAQGRAELATEIKVQNRDTQLLGQRLNEVFERAGTTERFESSVATVLDGALRRAEVDKHQQLSEAVAPLVVRTIKTEIRNSQDDLVEALYPMTGRMVKAYVASAIKDLTRDINRKLEQNPVMLRLRSLATGRSVAELAIADSQQLEVEELYLIRRGSGELLARWPDAPGSANRDHVMSGILTAINEFSSEALQEDGSSLREIDLGERQLYLRASPVFLLAAKTGGTAAPAIEALLDDSFLAAIERLNREPEDGVARSAILSEQFKELQGRLSDKQAELREAATGISPLKLLAWSIGLPLAAWIAWSVFADYRTSRAEAIATAVLSQSNAFSGYPAKLEVGRMGSVVTINGLSPSLEAKSELLSRLKEALPGSVIRDELSVLPSGLAEVEPELQRVRRNVSDLEPEIDKVRKEVRTLAPKVAGVETGLGTVKAEVARSAFLRDIERSSLRIAALAHELPRLAELGLSPAEMQQIAKVKSLLPALETDLAALEAAAARDTTDAAALLKLSPVTRGISERVRSAALELAALLPAQSALPALEPRTGDEAGPDAVALAAETERLSAVAGSVLQVAAFRKSLPPPPAPAAPVVVEKVKEPTAREALEVWVRSNAVFFGNDLDYRDAERAERTLEELAALILESDATVRVVGYTDEKGGVTKNSPLSRSRADKVVAELIGKGVPQNRLIPLGRNNEREISPGTGPSSPNRRVEFELGFEGEAAE